MPNIRQVGDPIEKRNRPFEVSIYRNVVELANLF